MAYEVPNWGGLASFTEWWKSNAAGLASQQGAYYKTKYIDPLNKLLGYNEGTGQWGTSPWSKYGWGDTTDPNSYASKYAGYQSGMDALLARLGAGPQASDMQDAAAQVAQSYGYSPASWAIIQQNMEARLNASNVMGTASDLALAQQQSPFGQEQARANEVALRQAEAAVGKQLEAIFGERGGLAGFQAAYDLTSQLQNTYLQQVTQQNLAMLDRSMAAVNGENQYYQELVNKGAIQAQDYLRFRWDAFQTSYADYAMSMDQVLKQYTTVNATESENLKNQINSITNAMAQEMGLSDWTLQNVQGWYNFWSQLMQDYDAAAGTQIPPQSNRADLGPPEPERTERTGGGRERDRGGGGNTYGDLRGGGGPL